MIALRTREYPARGGILPQTISVVVLALLSSKAVSGVMVNMTPITINTCDVEK